MAHNFWITVNTGDSWSAGQHNLYGRDNDLAYWVGTTVGDTEYYISATAKSRLPIGTAQQRYAVNPGATAPEWVNGGMTLLEEFVSVGGETDYTFAAISQVFRHLKMVIAGRGEKAAAESTILVQFSGDTGANYAQNVVAIYANIFAQAYTGGRTSLHIGSIPAATAAAGYLGGVEMIIPNYRNTAFYKSVQSTFSEITLPDISGCATHINHGVWLDTDPITDIKISLTDGTHTFVAGTIISLYGMA